MFNVKSILCLAAISLMAPLNAGQVQSIPYPNTVTEQSGSYEWKNLPIVYTTDQLAPEADYLKAELAKLKLTVPVEPGTAGKGGVSLKLDPALKTPESYKLTITGKGIAIEGADRAGVFYGIQTLLQQIRASEKDGKVSLACVKIEDAPRYHWRGFMLDVSRHFFGPEKIKSLLDTMAYYKMNKFHWHLTDEDGWRIEIKKYPRLTTVGSIGSRSTPEKGEPQFYTQDQIKDIVKYAADRHIEVIPEIDMPGHANASNRAYPEYSGGFTPKKPHFTFNPGKEETYAYLTDILKEVTTLFPSPYIHLGGDEVHFGSKAWETNPDVQAMMKKHNFKNLNEVENYFNQRMVKTANDMGKKVIGWDELLLAKPDPKKNVIMWWRHDRPNVLKESLSKGYPTIMAPRRPLYFDFIQHAGHKVGRVWGGFNPLEDVYAFPDKGMASWKIPAAQQKNIMGIQANLWTENYSSNPQIEYRIYPRLCALAESAWTAPEAKDYASFTERMNNAYKLFDELGINYFDARNPEKTPEPAKGKVNLPQNFRD